jgi:hypothetical protein
MGAEESDMHFLEACPRSPFLFDPHDGHRHVVYAGAILPRAHATLEALFVAIRRICERERGKDPRWRFHFIGTGNAPGRTVSAWAERLGVSGVVREYPKRIPYLDVLNHLKHADAILVLGSSEAHYTPSKVFQAVLARRPVIGIMHARSTAVEILRQANAGAVVTFDEALPVTMRIEEIEQALTQALGRSSYAPNRVDWEAFRPYSAEAMAERLASAFDATLERWS